MSLLITGSEGRAVKSGIRPGGRVVSINGEPVLDFVDYNWFSAQSKLEIVVEAEQGRKTYRVNKDSEEAIGLELEGLYPDERRCANHCIFCFVDQMPKGMRESLYVKDDDWRYSVLFGNYITLTNVSDAEFQRMVRRAPSPLYVSVHATDPEVRVKMMGNPAAGQIMGQLKRLTEAGITVHCQVVLVPGYNGGTVLQKTLEDLYGLYPGVRTVAVVPLGLTGCRQGLTVLKPVGQPEATKAVETVIRFAAKCCKECGARFALASDELYERAGLPAPRYDGGEHTPQLANGVGMVSDLLDEFEWALSELPDKLPTHRRVTIATGVSAFGLMEKISRELEGRVGNLQVSVLKVVNRLFGPEVTVAGLLVGHDIAAAAFGHELGQQLLLPRTALRSGEDVFLDGMTLEELSIEIGIPVNAVSCDGAELAFAACGLEDNN